MRSVSAVLFLSVIFAAFFNVGTTLAATPEATYQKICQGYTGNPSGSDTFGASTDGATMRTYLEHKVICPSACFNVKVALSVSGFSLKLTTTATNVCANPQPQSTQIKNVFSQLVPPNAFRNCSSTGKGAPSIVLQSESIPGHVSAPVTVGPKTRCDPNILATISTFANGNLQGGLSSAANLDNPSTAEDLSAKQAASGPLDASQYAPVLKAFDNTLTDSQIADAIKNNPDDVKILAECRANSDTCTPDKLTTAVTNIGIKLNPDVTNQIEQMKADWQDKQAANASADVGLTPDAINTFNNGDVQDIDRAKCAIATIESGSCGGNYGTIGPSTRTGARAFGKYQVMDFNVPSWTAQSCGYSLSPYAFLADSGCQEKVFENVFGGYASSCGSYEAAASKWFSGRCNITNSNDGSLSVNGYVSKFSNVFSNGNMPFGAAGAPYTGGGSPFAQTNPFYASVSDGQLVCTGTGYCYLNNSSYPGPVSTGSPVSTGGTVSTGSTIPTTSSPTPVSQLLGQTGTVQVAGTSSSAPAAATLLVQPKSVKKGNPVTISWSSVGMNTDQPCQLFSGNSFMAQANEGTRAFDTNPVATGTAVTFTLQCFSQANVKVQQTSTINVQ